jgi:PAS domain S-box-containing protein
MSNRTISNNISVQQVIDMLDLVSDVFFWIKDKEGLVVHCNKAYVDLTEYKNIESVIGKSDRDLFPNYLANQFILDDQKVLQGQSITNRLEMNLQKSKKLIWFTTSKRALKDADGQIIGTYGVTRNLNETVTSISNIDKIKEPVEYVNNHFEQEISIQDLADVACLSVSALERRFKKYLDKTPKQFIREVRLENARRLLIESQQPISEVAYHSGFTCHSYFSQHFKEMFGELPTKYRKIICSNI